MADFMKLLQQAQEMQGRLQTIQEELKQRTVSAASGGGMVKVEADGKGHLRSVKIDPTVVNPADVEMLEDLVLVAVTEVQRKAQALEQEEMGKLTGGLNLPFKLPSEMSVIEDLAAELAKLPGIGRKTAQRLTYHLLKQSPEQSRSLAHALLVLAERIHPCARCFNVTEDDLCGVCRDPRRDLSVICAVEEASDIGAIERSGEYWGVYHVLGGRLSPLDGIGPEDLTIERLIERVNEGTVREVILATNASLEGEATALYLQRRLAGRAVVVSRIARGLPVGGDLEYADGVTIAQALTARRGDVVTQSREVWRGR